MSLLDIVRSAVKIADEVTKPLQPEVQFQHYASSNYQGDKGGGSLVKLRAIVEWKQQQVRNREGIVSISRAYVMFLDVGKLAAATGGENIDDKDLIILPDGTTGPILNMTGFVDAGTGNAIATEVYLG